MTVSVVVPYRAGCPWRDRALAWTLSRYTETLPAAEVVRGACDPDLPFNRAAAILDGAGRSSGDTVIVADADCWSDGVLEAAAVVADGAPWAIPHRLVHRLSDASTDRVLAGEDWRGLPLSEDNSQDRRPYQGSETGTLVVLRRDVLLDVPPDPRFVGWGQEDRAWALALRALVGRPWRGADDLVHLWHPPQARQSRIVGSDEGFRLYRRYRAARSSPDAMRGLVAEARAHPREVTCPVP